jgi:hypothetical protein
MSTFGHAHLAGTGKMKGGSGPYKIFYSGGKIRVSERSNASKFSKFCPWLKTPLLKCGLLFCTGFRLLSSFVLYEVELLELGMPNLAVG